GLLIRRSRVRDPPGSLTPQRVTAPRWRLVATLWDILWEYGRPEDRSSSETLTHHGARESQPVVVCERKRSRSGAIFTARATRTAPGRLGDDRAGIAEPPRASC